MVDFHAHLGNVWRHLPDRPPITAELLLERMDAQGVQISVLLPLESPEVTAGWSLTEEAIEARDRYPDRFVAFMCIDPRQRAVPEQFDVFVEESGCAGFGELLNPLAFDDELNKVIYRKCDEYGFPLVFDMGPGQLYDEVGLPRLKSCLREFPRCIFCGHGPGFWSAISGADTRLGVYETGPVIPGGAIDRLMAEHGNLWLDLSAQSACTALTRDPEFTLGFVDRHWERMIWGSDWFQTDQQILDMNWFRELGVDDERVRAIAGGNARRLLGLPNNGLES